MPVEVYQVYRHSDNKNIGKPTPNHEQALATCSRLTVADPNWTRGCLPNYDIRVIHRTPITK